MPIADQVFAKVDNALQAGRVDVVQAYIPTLQAETTDPRALSLLGKLQAHQGDHAGGLALLGEAIRLDPSFASAYRLRAEVYGLVGEADAAARDLATAVQINPELRELLPVYAELALRAKIFDEAAETLAVIAERDPQNAFCLNLVGAMLQLAERCAEAVAYHERAFAIDGSNADYANNMGTSLRRLARFEEAEEFLARAVALDPNHYMAWYNLGNIFRATGRLILAERAYRRSIALFSTFPESHFTLACVLLQRNQWDEGWREFEWRWQSERIVAPITCELPLWDGTQTAGRRILVVTEQGSGDTIQMSRYTKQLVERGAVVTIWAPKETAALMRRLPHITAADTYRNGMPPSDVYIPMMSLPRVLQATPDNIPQEPYLHFDREKAREFARLLGPRRNRLRIGIAWAGNPKQGDDYLRSAKLQDFAALFDAPDVEWIGVQKGPRAVEILDSDFPIRDISNELDSFDTSAALFANLDGLVSVCTGPLHLAGALGIQSVCMLSASGDWRWCEDEHRTNWYPSVRLVRQSTQGDWQNVAERTVKIIPQWQPGTLLERLQGASS